MAAPHCQIVISGHLGTTEVFATGYALAGQAGNQATLDATVAAVAALLSGSSATATTMKSLLDPASGYDRVTGYSYANAGVPASLVSEAAIAVVGAGTRKTDNTTCAVATLETATPGRSTRGRMYLPLVTATITAFGTYSAPATADLAAAVKAILLADGTNANPVVVSTVLQVGTPITEIRVQNKPFTQRRRNEKVTSTVSATVAVP